MNGDENIEQEELHKFRPSLYLIQLDISTLYNYGITTTEFINKINLAKRQKC